MRSQFNVNIDPNHAAQVRAEADRSGKSQGTVLEAMIRAFLLRYNRREREQAYKEREAEL